MLLPRQNSQGPNSHLHENLFILVWQWKETLQCLQILNGYLQCQNIGNPSRKDQLPTLMRLAWLWSYGFDLLWVLFLDTLQYQPRHFHKLGISLPAQRQPFAVIVCGCNSNVSKVWRPKTKKYLFPLILQGWFLVCKKMYLLSLTSSRALGFQEPQSPQWPHVALHHRGGKAGVEVWSVCCWRAVGPDPNLQPQPAPSWWAHSTEAGLQWVGQNM